uniref:Uncharacterized protein n=1 Tax=Strongyloides papillosus TaxID=174720 RepID=A0A0N5B4Z0_STREA
MYSTSFNKVAQVIILLCFISFAVINCETNTQFSNEFKNAPIRARRQLSIGATGQLGDRLHKEKENDLKETVTKHYKDPSDPYGFGK